MILSRPLTESDMRPGPGTSAFRANMTLISIWAAASGQTAIAAHGEPAVVSLCRSLGRADA